jgi:hypothetical protein
MIYALKPVCKKDWKRKNGTSLVFIQYCMGSNQRTLVDTQIAIPPEYWNRKLLKVYEDLPPEYGAATELNGTLAENGAVGRGYFELLFEEHKR